MDDLEALLRKLADSPAFWDKGSTDSGSLTWPSAPADGDRKWPLVLIYCPHGHALTTVNLSFDEGATRWNVHSDSNGQSRDGGEGARYLGSSVTLGRTIFECEQCKVKRPRVARRIVSGKYLVEMYAAAVVAGKDYLRLS